MAFKIGDVVKLKSGGPHMTVYHIEKDKISCFWISGDNKHEIRVPPETLIIVS